MNTGTFSPANPLEEALLTAARDPRAMRQFRAALADQQVLVPVASEPIGDRVEFPLIELDGETHIAVFTSSEQLSRSGAGSPAHLALTGRDLARMWPSGVAMAINPGGELGFSMPAADVEALTAAPAGGAGERRIPAGAELLIGAPRGEPHALLERLRAAAATLADVTALHRALVKVKDSPDPPQLVIGVELTSTARGAAAVLARLAETAGAEAALLPLTPGASDPVSAWMRERNDPFYAAS